MAVILPTDSTHSLCRFFFLICVVKCKVMYPSFTYAELQEKFCEGFAFFPFEALEQHGRFIYKQYTAGHNTRGLLDSYNSYNDSSLHAQVLLLKLQQRDIPVAAELMGRIRADHYRLEERVSNMKRRPLIYKQLLETMDTYHRILTVYQHQVQEQIVAQLLAISDINGPLSFEAVSVENLANIGSVVQEFLHSTEIIYGFLYGCIRQMPGFKKLVLSAGEREEMEALLKTIRTFRSLQKKTIQLLEQWKHQGALQKEQRTMN